MRRSSSYQNQPPILFGSSSYDEEQGIYDLAYICDHTAEYPPCDEPSEAKQEYTWYYLLPESLPERGWLVNGEWIIDDDFYWAALAFDWPYLQICNNYIAPRLLLDDEAGSWPNGLKVWFLTGSTKLGNPVWSGGENSYGPAEADDGPALFVAAVIETCVPPQELTIEVVSRQNIEDTLGQDVGNAYEEADVGDWDTPAFLGRKWHYPPVALVEGIRSVSEIRQTIHADEQPLIRRVIAEECSGQNKEFTFGWDGRQWDTWNTYQNPPKDDDGGTPYYPPGVYEVVVRAKLPLLGEVSKRLGRVSLVYGAMLLDGYESPSPLPDDKLRWLKQLYINENIRPVLYFSPNKNKHGLTQSFSYLTFWSGALFSPVLHYDGDTPRLSLGPFEDDFAIRNNLVFLDGCEGGALRGTFNSQVYIYYPTKIRVMQAMVWADYFYRHLFVDRKVDQSRYTIAEALSFANNEVKKHASWYFRKRIPNAFPVAEEYVSGPGKGLNQTVDNFEHTDR